MSNGSHVQFGLLNAHLRKDDVDLQGDGGTIGSQSAIRVILEVLPEDAAEYDYFITHLNTGCENTSDPATLTVHGP